MLAVDEKTKTKMAAQLRRILVVDSTPSAVRMLAELLRSVTTGQVYHAPTIEQGLKMARSCDPHVIFVEQAQGVNDAAAFTRGLRRSELRCRKAPVIVVTSEATAGAIIAARDAGAHEFLRRPYTIKDLVRRLEAVTLHPRDWVEAVHYIGPDRRRFNSGDYKGVRKRKSDAKATPDQARILQALKIVRAAALAIESDPMQARRALATQAADLQKMAVTVADMKLVEAAAGLAKCVAPDQPLTFANLKPYVDKLATFIPAEEQARPAA